jgi:hypothetical protein
MAAVSDGTKKTASVDAVSKNQHGSVSLSALPVGATTEKKSKKEKRDDTLTPHITVDAAPVSPRNSSSSPTKSKPEKSNATASTKVPKDKSDEKGSSSTREGKSSTSKKLLKEELAVAHKEIARLQKENEELREQLETLQGVISVQAEQRAMTKKQQRRHKQKQQAATTSTPRSADDSSDEEEFGDDQETETFDKAASSDDTQVKRKLLEHKRTRSIDEQSPGLNALVDSQLPPAQRRPNAKLSGSSSSNSSGSILTQSLPVGRDDASTSSAPATPSGENGSAAPKQRPTRPTRPTNSSIPPRKTKFATATNLSKTFISQEDEKELVGSATGNDAARGRIMNNFALVSGEATPHSLKIGVLGTPDPNAPKPSSSNDDHPHIFDENTVLDILCGLGITSSRQFDDSADGSVLIPKDFSYSYQFKVRRHPSSSVCGCPRSASFHI